MDAVTLLHLGAMHPYEHVLTLLLAFGPFVVLGIVIVLRRRADARDETPEEERLEAARTQRDR